ncbi:hypothetical protein BC831DRAFT_510618 [Entophlyctis helioformis]|nr:hypothetical protein BC831DRAFT_510618 [Entophlyctis helioformis]
MPDQRRPSRASISAASGTAQSAVSASTSSAVPPSMQPPTAARFGTSTTEASQRHGAHSFRTTDSLGRNLKSGLNSNNTNNTSGGGGGGGGAGAGGAGHRKSVAPHSPIAEVGFGDRLGPQHGHIRHRGVQHHAANEIERYRASIQGVRQALEFTERLYKDHQILGRAVAPTVFGNIEIPKASTDDDFSAQLVARAHDELDRIEAARKAREEIKNKTAAMVEENLAKQIEQAKERFRRQPSPEFRRHFYCVFGEILNVTALMDNLYAVYSTNNTLEIWTIQDDERDPSTLRKLITIDTDPIIYVQHLYTENISILGDAGTSADNADAAAVAFNGGPVGGTMTVNFDAVVVGKPARSHSLPKFANARTKDVGNMKELEKVLSPEDMELLREHLGEVRYHSLFFLGCSTGVDYEFSIITQRKISYIPVKLSQYYKLTDGLPLIVAEVATNTGEHILQAFTMALDIEWTCKCDLLRLTSLDHLTRVVPQDKFETAGRRLEDFRNVDQELMVTTFCEDNHHKSLVLALRNGCLIRISYSHELHNETDRLGTSAGLTSRRTSLAVPGAGPADRPRASISSPGGGIVDYNSANYDRQLKITWCLDLFPQHPDEHLRPGRRNLNAIDEANEPHGAHSNHPPRSPSMVPQQVPDKFRVTSMRYMVNQSTQKPQLVVAGNDGIVRIYPNDLAKILSKPVSVFKLDRDEPSGSEFDSEETVKARPPPTVPYLDTFLACSTEQFVVMYTSRSTLVTYDPVDHKTSTIEMKIASNRQGVLQLADAPSAPSDKVPRNVQIVDDDMGLGILSYGREWCIFSLERLVGWSKNRKEMPQ